MSYMYQALLGNTINQIISKLLAGPQPDKDPGMTAWAWFRATSGAQPSQADEYVQSQLAVGMSTTANPWYGPVNNWLSWSSALNVALSGATGDVRKWLDGLYGVASADTPTVPEDVITWTKSNLPTSINGVGVTVVKRQGQTAKY